MESGRAALCDHRPGHGRHEAGRSGRGLTGCPLSQAAQSGRAARRRKAAARVRNPGARGELRRQIITTLRGMAPGVGTRAISCPWVIPASIASCGRRVIPSPSSTIATSVARLVAAMGRQWLRLSPRRGGRLTAPVVRCRVRWARSWGWSWFPQKTMRGAGCIGSANQPSAQIVGLSFKHAPKRLSASRSGQFTAGRQEAHQYRKAPRG